MQLKILLIPIKNISEAEAGMNCLGMVFLLEGHLLAGSGEGCVSSYWWRQLGQRPCLPAFCRTMGWEDAV